MLPTKTLTLIYPFHTCLRSLLPLYSHTHIYILTQFTLPNTGKGYTRTRLACLLSSFFLSSALCSSTGVHALKISSVSLPSLPPRAALANWMFIPIFLPHPMYQTLARWMIVPAFLPLLLRPALAHWIIVPAFLPLLLCPALARWMIVLAFFPHISCCFSALLGIEENINYFANSCSI